MFNNFCFFFNNFPAFGKMKDPAWQRTQRQDICDQKFEIWFGSLDGKILMIGRLLWEEWIIFELFVIIVVLFDNPYMSY